MRRLLIALFILAMLLSMVSCDLIDSIISGNETEDGGAGDSEEDGEGGSSANTPTENTKPKESVTSWGLTFTLAASKKEYILTKAAGGTAEYNVPAEIEGLPVTEIASGAFKNQLSLVKVTLPDTIRKINISIFEGCRNLRELDIPFIGESGTTSSGNNTNCIGYFFDTERPAGADGWTGTSMGTPYTDSYIQYWVPESLEVIRLRGGATWEHTFKGAQLTEAYLGGGIHHIPTGLFKGQKALVSVTCENDITSVGKEAFWNCYNLKNFIITGKSAWIGMGAFENCHDLEWIILSAGTTDIQNLAFDDCESFKAIYYLGSLEDFDKIEKGSNNWELEQAIVYIYSETRPDACGNYWHYDGDGMPVVWGE